MTGPVSKGEARKSGQKPGDPDSDRQHSEDTQQPLVGPCALLCAAIGQPADQCRKTGHRRHGAKPEAADICRCRGPRRKSERGKHAQKVGASGETVKDPHAERHARGPGVNVGPAMRMIRSGGMLSPLLAIQRVNVQMDVTGLAVRVFVSVDPLASRLPDAPGTDSDQHETHELFAPVRQKLDRKQAPKENRCESDEKHPARVPESPEETGPPRAAVAVRCQWSHGRKVIGSGQNVHGARRQPGDDRREQLDLEIVSRRHQDPSRARARFPS